MRRPLLSALSLTIADPDSQDEQRLVLVGFTYEGKLVVVVHIDRDQTIRIITARLATSHERNAYEDER